MRSLINSRVIFGLSSQLGPKFLIKGSHRVTRVGINEVLTEVLSEVQQDPRGSSVQLVKERAEAEEEECSHAETITSQGKSEWQRGEDAALSVVSLSDVIRDLVVAVKGTAAEILHHLLLTKRRGKSPIRLREVKLVFLGSLGPAPLRLLGPGLLFSAQPRSLPLDPARLRTSGDCSFLPF